MSESKYLNVQKDTLRKIILLADQNRKLSEKLENNQLDLQILLHALISEAKHIKRSKELPARLLLDSEKKRRKNDD